MLEALSITDYRLLKNEEFKIISDTLQGTLATYRFIIFIHIGEQVSSQKVKSQEDYVWTELAG